MKKSIITLIFTGLIGTVFGQTTADLNGVTFGFGAGYSSTFTKTYDYSLTTDANHNLKLQPLSQSGFVISSVIMVKLGKVAIDQGNNTFVKQSKKSEYNDQKILLNEQIEKIKTLKEQSKTIHDKKELDQTQKQLSDENSKLKDLEDQLSNAKAGFLDHLSINLALNLVDVAPNVSFNKNINGGLGLGYFITDNLQASIFYDVARISQLRDYVVNTYQDKPIPNGTGTNYNSLDTNDSNLFYNKTISGISFKLIFSIGNKKTDQSQ